MRYYSVAEVALRLKVPRRTISDMLYREKLDLARCPLMAGRRVIPDDYVEAIGEKIREIQTQCKP